MVLTTRSAPPGVLWAEKRAGRRRLLCSDLTRETAPVEGGRPSRLDGGLGVRNQIELKIFASRKVGCKPQKVDAANNHSLPLNGPE